MRFRIRLLLLTTTTLLIAVAFAFLSLFNVNNDPFLRGLSFGGTLITGLMYYIFAILLVRKHNQNYKNIMYIECQMVELDTDWLIYDVNDNSNFDRGPNREEVLAKFLIRNISNYTTINILNEKDKK